VGTLYYMDYKSVLTTGVINKFTRFIIVKICFEVKKILDLLSEK
jgi:hypothetical protein